MLTTVSAVPMIQQKARRSGRDIGQAHRCHRSLCPPLARRLNSGFDLNTWTGLFVPAKTPQAVVTRLATGTSMPCSRCLIAQAPGRRRRYAWLRTQASFVQFLKKEKPAMPRSLKSANIQAE